LIPPVVDIGWLSEADGDVVLADVRWYMDGRSGRDAYRSGHLPGAVFVDLDKELAGDPHGGGGRHPLPDPESFARAMSEHGIGDETVVIAYDDGGGVIAARLVWMLRATGHDSALLDGGIDAYGGPLETTTPVVEAAEFTPRPWPIPRLADIEDVIDPSGVLVDARNRERYLGEVETVDARAGHIPGARSLPCRANVDGNGKLLPTDVLRSRFESIGVLPGIPVIAYCGSGVTACHDLLVQELCGLGEGRLYPGSWSEYSAIREMPLETGDAPQTG
jgi:thiosulfate/3-mercaptopyruvate sulfurtransferase